MRTLTRLCLALATLALAVGCTEDSSTPEEGALGSVSLVDSTDKTGKADQLGGRAVIPKVSADYLLDGTEDRGEVVVSELTDDTMTVEGPLVRFEKPVESLQVTIESADQSGDTVLRFLIAYRLDDAQYYTPLTVDAPGSFEDADDVENETRGDETQVRLSYFQSVSILAGDENTITVSSDESAGQSTVALEFAASEAEWAAFVIPVDSGWAPLEDTFGYTLTAACDGSVCGDAPEPPEPAEPWADAKDVTLGVITPDGAAPDSYTRPSVDGGFGLGGTEFWQQWPDGHSPTFSFSAGTDQGRYCMQASAIRFEAIMAEAPEEMKTLLENSNWSGRFFNWNDDFTESDFRDASGARLWAWRTGLIKWISQTGKDGRCYLPTLEQVVRVAEVCQQYAEQGEGEIQGCSVR